MSDIRLHSGPAPHAHGLAAIVGNSVVMRDLRALIRRVAPTNLSVLIQGPTGAGKELVAQALHTASGRCGRFVPVNVCAIPETMFEDDLFGHVRGAFTGAISDKSGYLAEADRGTLLLDEIGSLALPLQAKLLRAIETGEYRPVGARNSRRSRFRVVTAINESLATLVTAGRFRSDLAERLSGIIIDVPPLSERPEDIPALAAHFAAAFSNGNPGATLTSGAIRMLQSHDWPGNVRELRHAVQRAIALSGRRVLGHEEIIDTLGLVEGTLTSNTPAPAEDYPHAAARRRLIQMLRECTWDTARVAERLGIHRATVYRRMDKLGIPAPRVVQRLKVRGSEDPPRASGNGRTR